MLLAGSEFGFVAFKSPIIVVTMMHCSTLWQSMQLWRTHTCASHILQEKIIAACSGVVPVSPSVALLSGGMQKCIPERISDPIIANEFLRRARNENDCLVHVLCVSASPPGLHGSSHSDWARATSPTS